MLAVTPPAEFGTDQPMVLVLRQGVVGSCGTTLAAQGMLKCITKPTPARSPPRESTALRTMTWSQTVNPAVTELEAAPQALVLASVPRVVMAQLGKHPTPVLVRARLDSMGVEGLPPPLAAVLASPGSIASLVPPLALRAMLGTPLTAIQQVLVRPVANPVLLVNSLARSGLAPAATVKVSERNERAFWKTNILAMMCAKWLQT